MDYREDSEIRINNIQARGFVVRDGLVLMMHRIKNGKEYYVFPGGHMRYGESPEQTALREIEEETTIKCEVIKLAFEFHDNSQEHPEHEYFFHCKWLSGEPTLSGEESRRSNELNYYEPLWVKISEIGGLKVYPSLGSEWVRNNAISSN